MENKIIDEYVLPNRCITEQLESEALICLVHYQAFLKSIERKFMTAIGCNKDIYVFLRDEFYRCDTLQKVLDNDRDAYKKINTFEDSLSSIKKSSKYDITKTYKNVDDLVFLSDELLFITSTEKLLKCYLENFYYLDNGMGTSLSNRELSTETRYEKVNTLYNSCISMREETYKKYNDIIIRLIECDYEQKMNVNDKDRKKSMFRIIINMIISKFHK